MDITPEDLEKLLKKIQELPPEELEKLGKEWVKLDNTLKQAVEDSMIENVTTIQGSTGTDCNSAQPERVAREAGVPEHSDWIVVNTWTEKSIIAKAKKYVPSARYLTYGFAELQRTWNYVCQKQKCVNGHWTDVGQQYACNRTESKEVQVYGGPNEDAPLQGWTDAAIRQSIASGWYK